MTHGGDVTFTATADVPSEFAFLRQEWISGEGDGVTFELDCGAGLTAWVNRMSEEMRA